MVATYEHYCKSYTGIGDMVLEVVGGYCVKNNIKEGDSVYFE